MLRIATQRHQVAGRAVTVRAAFIRAEVAAVQEFEHSWHRSTAAVSRAAGRDTDPPMVTTELYDATRALLSASTPARVTDILTGFVLAVGATVNAARPAEHDDRLSIDLSIVPGQELHDMANRISLPGLILERWLPHPGGRRQAEAEPTGATLTR